MSKSTDPDHFFQTDHSVAETRRKALKSSNKHGAPIRLQSKILAVIPDPTRPSDTIYVAESTGTARRIVLDNDENSPPYRGPTAPATCLAISPLNSSASSSLVLFAGSWDKTIYSWHARTRAPHRIYSNGHTDFVKALVTACLPSSGSASPTAVLVSGGADARIIIWAIATGEKLHVLRPHANPGGAVLGFALSRPAISDGADDSLKDKDHKNAESVTLFTAHTLPSILRFSLALDPVASLAQIAPDKPIMVHETSVYGLHFDTDGDLWTASADGDVTCLAREKDWQVEMRIQTNGGWVRGVAVDEEGGWVVSVGRDEEVRVWERGPRENQTGELHHVYSGHYDEITGVVVLPRSGQHPQQAVTVGLDGTVRRWSLHPAELEDARRKKEKEAAEGEGTDGDGGGGGEEEEAVLDKETLVTEEEERELAALMDYDDAE
ncbi:hypothetical protein MMC07_000944 [Pseudocyphellaria aurata]|nr:hypothetical protein [Pseudocyphellaria aurata]